MTLSEGGLERLYVPVAAFGGDAADCPVRVGESLFRNFHLPVLYRLMDGLVFDFTEPQVCKPARDVEICRDVSHGYPFHRLVVYELTGLLYQMRGGG